MSKTTAPTPGDAAEPRQPAAPGEGTYGYAVPAGRAHDPSRGHEMERDALPPNADFSKPLTDKQRQYVDTLQSSANSLLSLIEGLLDISRIESQAIELEAVPFSLNALARDVVSILSLSASQKKLHFDLDDLTGPDAVYRGDPTRIKQILLNLAGNAIKFTEKGRVRVTLRPEKSERADTGSFSIIVEDTGIGIEEEKIGVIFEKFVQGDSSINRRYGGSGLGLAITSMFVKLMNGTVAVRSRIGEGSVFTVVLTLPLAHFDAGSRIHGSRDNAPPIFPSILQSL